MATRWKNDPTANNVSPIISEQDERRNRQAREQAERLAWERAERERIRQEADRLRYAADFEESVADPVNRREAERKAMQDRIRERTMARLNAYQPAFPPDRNPEDMTEEERTEYRNREVLERLDKEDPIRYFDKAMLDFFVEESGRSLFPAEDPEPLNLKALQAELKQQTDEGTEDPEYENVDPLLTIYREIHAYTQINHTGSSLHHAAHNDSKVYYLESRLAMRIYRRLTRLEDRMYEEIGQLNSGKIAEPVNATDERMHAVSNLMSYFEQQLFGKLGTIPEQPIDENAPHIVYTGKMLRHSTKEQLLQDDLNRQDKQDELVIERDHRNIPLFSHTPSPQDIKQGYIGDCYMVAPMSALAASHPERIQEMMRDNRDGTVTVRLYQGYSGHYSPIYVTVDKIYTAGQSTGSEWVQTLERAVAVSGLIPSVHYQLKHLKHNLLGSPLPIDPKPVPADIDEIYEKYKDNPLAISQEEYPWLFDEEGHFRRWEPDYDSISRGSTSMIFGMFLGDEAEVTNRQTTSDLSEGQRLSPQNEAGIRKIPLDQEYKKNELKIFNEIDQALKKHCSVTAATYPSSQGGDDVTVAGINKTHAYTVLGTKRIMIEGRERLFLRIRNPHGNVGRTYIRTTTEVNGREKEAILGVDNSRLKNSLNPGNNGTGYIELSDFVREFYNYTYAEAPESSVEKQQRLSDTERQVMTAYQKAFRDILDYMEPASREQRSKWDSRQYRQLRRDLRDLSAHPLKSYSALEQRMTALEEKIRIYTAHAAETLDNHDRSRELKLDGCSMLTDVIRQSREGFRLPQTVLKAKIADRILNLIRAKDVSGLPADDPMSRMKQFVTDHPGTAGKRVLLSTEFRKWTQQNSSLADLFQALGNPAMTLEDFGITKLSASLEDRPLEKLQRHPEQAKPKNDAPQQPDPGSLPPELPEQVREISF